MALEEGGEYYMARLILGIFQSENAAQDAITRLEERGYDPKDVSIIMRGREDNTTVQRSGVGDVAEGTISGATAGGVLGALAGLLIANGIVPGLGPILVGGPLASALGLTGVAATAVSGAVTGALAGGVLGALTSFGLSEEDARVYEDSIKEGGILLIVPTRIGDEVEVRDLLSDFGASQIKSIEHTDMEESSRYKEPTFTGAYAHEIRKKRSTR